MQVFKVDGGVCTLSFKQLNNIVMFDDDLENLSLGNVIYSIYGDIYLNDSSIAILKEELKNEKVSNKKLNTFDFSPAEISMAFIGNNIEIPKTCKMPNEPKPKPKPKPENEQAKQKKVRNKYFRADILPDLTYSLKLKNKSAINATNVESIKEAILQETSIKNMNLVIRIFKDDCDTGDRVKYIIKGNGVWEMQ